MGDDAAEPIIDFTAVDRTEPEGARFQGVLWGYIFTWAVSLPFMRLADLPDAASSVLGVIGAAIGYRIARRHPEVWDEARGVRWPWWANVLVVTAGLAHLGLYISTD